MIFSRKELWSSLVWSVNWDTLLSRLKSIFSFREAMMVPFMFLSYALALLIQAGVWDWIGQGGCRSGPHQGRTYAQLSRRRTTLASLVTPSQQTIPYLFNHRNLNMSIHTQVCCMLWEPRGQRSSKLTKENPWAGNQDNKKPGQRRRMRTLHVEGEALAIGYLRTAQYGLTEGKYLEA